MPLKNYSSGMVARIAFAIATVTEPDILIVDETLSVGDVFFQEKCLNNASAASSNPARVTVLFVSHSIDQVEHICSRCVWIEKGAAAHGRPHRPRSCEALREPVQVAPRSASPGREGLKNA